MQSILLLFNNFPGYCSTADYVFEAADVLFENKKLFSEYHQFSSELDPAIHAIFGVDEYSKSFPNFNYQFANCNFKCDINTGLIESVNTEPARIEVLETKKDLDYGSNVNLDGEVLVRDLSSFDHDNQINSSKLDNGDTQTAHSSDIHNIKVVYQWIRSVLIEDEDAAADTESCLQSSKITSKEMVNGKL